MEKFEVIIVGAGLAGLSAAYTLAQNGIEAVVVERGDYPGAKNVTGGRLYLNPVKKYLPDLWPALLEEKALERPVAVELLTLMAPETSTTLRFRSEEFARPPYHSFTVLRGVLDRWLAKKAEEKGAMLVTKNRVDELIRENGKVIGVVAGGEELGAEAVIAGDGVLSLVAEKAGLRIPGLPRDYAVGFKEVIELPSRSIEERFALGENEGAAQSFPRKPDERAIRRRVSLHQPLQHLPRSGFENPGSDGGPALSRRLPVFWTISKPVRKSPP